MEKLRKSTAGTSYFLKPRAKRCGSTGCTSAWHQLRAQLAEVCMQHNLGKKLEQISWDADHWDAGLWVSQGTIFHPSDSGDLNASFWHLTLVSSTSSGCTGCKEVPIRAKLQRTYTGPKAFCSDWCQRGSILRAFGLLRFEFILVCLDQNQLQGRKPLTIHIWKIVVFLWCGVS